MITGRDVLFAREQRRDALALAERERLARRALGLDIQRPRSKVSERCCLWLAQLGAQLVRWGENLQARYTQPSMSA
jgi:hypothetical protein